MLLLELPASARALALGNAFPGGPADSDALFHAPAFSSTLRGFALGGAWWSPEAMALSVSGAGEWWGGALAAGLQTLEYQGDVAYDDPRAAEALLGATGAQRISERVATIGYAHRVWKLELSVAAKLLDLRAGAASVRGPAFDVGVGRAVGPVRLVVAGQHLGPRLQVHDEVGADHARADQVVDALVQRELVGRQRERSEDAVLTLPSPRVLPCRPRPFARWLSGRWT